MLPRERSPFRDERIENLRQLDRKMRNALKSDELAATNAELRRSKQVDFVTASAHRRDNRHGLRRGAFPRQLVAASVLCQLLNSQM
jgi:hypothetical protein